ncbi:flagellar hook protein FlgE [Ancylobacter dichloromethanicus]|uniref:Flagellar hook protein FlgE n=1 Tax=Ancylobacter dichloromethanicus TaxID=518825 RepID=A0A9W6J630_9HYPH|nr:flagellar hook protein FlgE [Ancylobacter dichloromethanicus]MBS7556316.1 flagellar hook protein FlgE [Ancylobacter dichloromethanicus]GLK70079.1 flagellar hook protein FlgE [Ancylobacter dichloromethanicus]
MSLYGMMRTGVSGMSAQSNKLGTIADNIANSGTAGYKRAAAEFSTLLLQSGPGEYNSGAVNTNVRYAVSQQGALNYTTSATDLAVQGNGFFLVSDPNGTSYLTRAGSFTVDASTGNLVNAAGFTLMGYDITGGDPNVVLNGSGGLQPVRVADVRLAANPSRTGAFAANLPAAEAVMAGDTPAANLATSQFSQKSSLVAFDNLGSEMTLDVYLTKVGDAPIAWEMTVFDRADAAPNGDFPYANAALATQTLSFDNLGALTSTPSLSLAVPNGQTLTVDLTGMTQLADDYTPLTATIDGNAPASVSSITIDGDGVVSAIDTNGRKSPLYKIPLAFVTSPDNLSPKAGNVFETTNESGGLQIGFANEGGLGTMISGATERSTVDMASELTEMIAAQRDYTANSKVFQTGSELLDVLMNLKR